MVRLNQADGLARSHPRSAGGEAVGGDEVCRGVAALRRAAATAALRERCNRTVLLDPAGDALAHAVESAGRVRVLAVALGEHVPSVPRGLLGHRRGGEENRANHESRQQSSLGIHEPILQVPLQGAFTRFRERVYARSKENWKIDSDTIRAESALNKILAQRCSLRAQRGDCLLLRREIGCRRDARRRRESMRRGENARAAIGARASNSFEDALRRMRTSPGASLRSRRPSLVPSELARSGREGPTAACVDRACRATRRPG